MYQLDTCNLNKERGYSMIRFEHVTKQYGDNVILNDLNFEIEEGKFVILIGPSGCGKTTTLKMINRLIDPNSGHIYIDDKDINTIDKPALRRSIGYVIQQIGLFPNMTVAQNISVVPRLLKYPKEKCDQIVHELLKWSICPMSSMHTSIPPKCPAVSSSVSASSVPWLLLRRSF